jgi:outer membrane lipoprotein-sorting protein
MCTHPFVYFPRAAKLFHFKKSRRVIASVGSNFHAETERQFAKMNTDRSASTLKCKFGIRISIVAASVLVLCISAGAFQGDPELQKVFSQMDATAKNFRNFTASFTQKKYTAVLQEFDTPAKGDFYYARAKDGSALLRKEELSPGKSVLTIKNGVATFYQTSIKQAQIYNLGKNKDKAEYLAIGISQSPARLQENFNVAYQGSETVNGKPCSILLLKPKNPKEAAYFSSITVWFSKSDGIPLRNKMLEPNGDYLLIDFFNEKLNTNVPSSKFDQNLPTGVEIQKY